MSETGVLPTFKQRRIIGLAHIARLLGTGVIAFHKIVVEGAENLPRQGPGLLLPKHCAYRDILVEGVAIYRHTSRYATSVMKRGLWGILEHMGGVKVTRPKDIRRIEDRIERRAEIRRARAANRDMREYLSWLYAQGELILSHPEGMRYQDRMGPMQKEIIEHLLQVQEQRGLRVPMLPIGIEYESYTRPLSRVFFRVGRPIYADGETDITVLVDELGEQLRQLSGL